MSAACRLKLQQRVIAGDSSAKIKGCRQTEQSQDIRGKTRGHFLCKLCPIFTKIDVLCDVLTCVVNFCFSKRWVAVKVTQCCFKSVSVLLLWGFLPIRSTGIEMLVVIQSNHSLRTAQSTSGIFPLQKQPTDGQYDDVSMMSSQAIYDIKLYMINVMILGVYCCINVMMYL